MRYITKDKAKAQKTSKIECCFKNTVERQMEMVSIKAEPRIQCLFLSVLLWKIAIQAPTEFKV